MSYIKIPHIRVPRSLLENPLWIDLPPAYRDVFYVLLENVNFYPKQFDDHGVILDLEIGQWCGTYREFTKLLGKFGDKNIVERSIKKFILYGFVRQEVRHKKSILTIIHPDTYELIKRASETGSESGLRQDRDRIETEIKNIKKERKEEEHIPSASPSEKVIGLDFSNEIFENSSFEQNAGLISNSKNKNFSEGMTDNVRDDKFFFEKPKKEKFICQETKSSKKAKVQSDEYRKSLVSRRENIDTSHQEHEELIKTHGEEFTQCCYDYLAEWKKSKSLHDPKSVEAHSDFYRIKKWVIKALKESHTQKVSSTEENKLFSKKIEKSYVSEFYEIIILNNGIEFRPKYGQVVPDFVAYSENGFRDQLRSVLEKRKFKERK